MARKLTGGAVAAVRRGWKWIAPTAAVSGMLVLGSCGGTGGTPPPAAVGTSAPASAEATAAAAASPEPSDPVARGYHHLVCLHEAHGMLLFGGFTASPPAGGHPLGDSWLATTPPEWSRAEPGSVVPFGDAFAYDSGSERAVVFAIITPTLESVEETWGYDPAADRWERLATAQPEGLHGARAAYDSESDRIIVLTQGPSRTWAYDVDGNAWEEMSPADLPRIGTYHALAYDVGSDRVVAFGGGAGSGPGKTWSYDYNTDRWTEMAPVESPTDRFYHAMAYDLGTDRIVMFGGVQGGAETPLDETWAYDLDANTWTQLAPEVAPSPRGWTAMASNPTDGTLVLFGGGADRDHYQDDVWMYDPTANTWTEAS